MAKKISIRLGILLAVIVALWIAARITGALQFYIIPTIANEPNIKLKEKLFTTNLKNPQPYQFIVFTSKVQDSMNASYMPNFKEGSHYLYRLCGVPGDVIEMKNGILFVNNNNFDEKLNLKNQFKISSEDFGKIAEEDISTNEAETSITQNGGYNIVTFERTRIKKYQSKIKLLPYILTDTSTVSGIFKWYDKNSGWTADNFGPLKIPLDCYFALGDNRHNAMDCRFTGFIKKDDIKGVVLNK
jgi:signal peptidase I